MRKWASESGATAVEYAVLIGLIAVVVIVGALVLGSTTNDQLDCTADSLAAGLDSC